MQQQQRSILIPANKVGAVIGRGGATVRHIMHLTNCTITVAKSEDMERNFTIQEKAAGRGDAKRAEEIIRRIAFEGYSLPLPFIGDRCAPNRTLYVDILNFANRFFDAEDGWSIKATLGRITQLCNVLHSNSITFVCFIDILRVEEAKEKMQQRQVEQIRVGGREVPINVSGILSECFTRNGVEVRLSTEANNDDTIAAHAYHNPGVAILSGDRDFYRYVVKREKDDRMEPCRFELYADFAVEDGVFKLAKQTPPRGYQQREPILLKYGAELPKYSTGSTAAFWVKDIAETRSVIGGVCSPCIRSLSFNPFWTVAPLRKLLYSKIFPSPPPGEEAEAVVVVLEQFPVWDEATQTVLFPERLVQVDHTPNEEMMMLAKNPRSAFAHFFPRESAAAALPAELVGKVSEIRWWQHVHGCKSVIVDLCCMIDLTLSYVDVMIGMEEQV